MLNSSSHQFVKKPQLSLWALISFTASFIVARIFTSLSPSTVFIVSGRLHIHHFWFGIILLAIGGWLGISYDSDRMSHLAAIIFGSGGGLIADEIGLLLTLEDYWTGTTFLIVVPFLALCYIWVLVIRYWSTVKREFLGFVNHSASLYSGVFLAATAIAFIMETDDPIINIVAICSAVAGIILIIAYVIHRAL